MVRKWISLSTIQIYDKLHILQPDGSFIVDEEKDGQTTEKHIEGINYVKQVLLNGQKVMPVLVKDNGDGMYLRLDGFKRCLAHQQVGRKYIEAFVVTQDEYDRAIEFKADGYEMRAWHGGQDGEKGKLPLFEGGEKPNFNYDEVKFLFKSPNPAGLRIELCEAIHIHWGEFGKYRLIVGQEDFKELANAIKKIWE